MRGRVPGALSALADPAGRALSILLVEDDDGDALLVEAVLEDAPTAFAIQRATTLADAAAGKAQRADCILLDLGLPDAIGLEALTTLRHVAPDTAIVVLTGLTDEHRGVEALASGAQDYLVKGRADGDILPRAVRYAVERRRSERSERALLEAELHARENARLERGLLPRALLRDPTLQFDALSRPGRRRALLGGDFFDGVEVGDGTLHLLVGDVSGHGPDEAALGVLLRIAWRALTLAERPVEEVLDTLSELLVHERHDEDLFATLVVVTVGPSRDRARVWLAGHPAPILLGDGPPRPLQPARVHLPIGVADPGGWVGEDLPLPPSWSLLLHTDGLIEGLGPGGGPGRLGQQGLLEVLGALPITGGADALLLALVREVRALNGEEMLDDLATVLVSHDPTRRRL
jgi:serine phosphatase RsbU (regulator of sigma subunit)